MEINLAAGLLGFVFASVSLPLIIRGATRHRLFDHPDGVRRIHIEPIPRLGGVAVCVGATVAALVALAASALLGVGVSGNERLHLGILFGCSVVFLTGLLDDLRGISPTAKLLAQSLAAAIVIGYGLQPENVALVVGHSVNVGVFALPFLALWIVGTTNAFNLIDGVDGLAASIAVLALVVCIGLSFVFGSRDLVLTCAVLGAVIAFWRVNRHPARIFLGDSGSMTLGFFLAVQTVLSAQDTRGVSYVLVPLFALGYPVLDTSIAIARRWLRGDPFSRADGRHVHHQLLALGMSARGTVQLLVGFFTLVAIAGVLLVFAPPRLTLVLFLASGVAAVAAAIQAIRYLKYSEFIELGSSVVSVIRNARSVVRDKILAADLASKIEMAETTQQIESLLHSSVGDLRLLQIDLLPGDPHATGPEAQMFAPPDRLPFRLEYRLGWECDGQRREMILRLWCPHPPGTGHANAERVAARLAPALEQWVRRNPQAFSTPVQVARTRRTSGQHHRSRITDS